MISNPYLASLFDDRIVHGALTGVPVAVRDLAARVAAGTAPGPVFRPTAELEWVPAVISWICLAALVLLPLWMLVLSSNASLKASLQGAGTPTLVLGGLGLVLAFAWVAYYALWINLLAPGHLRRHAAEYYVYLGPEGALRRDGGTVTYVPWTIVAGSDLALGRVATSDGMEPVRSLDLRLDRGGFVTPALVKGYGPGVFFQDWFLFSEDQLREMAGLVERYAGATARSPR